LSGLQKIRFSAFQGMIIQKGSFKRKLGIGYQEYKISRIKMSSYATNVIIQNLKDKKIPYP